MIIQLIQFNKNNNTYYILIGRLESDPYPKLSA
jgi:hypothetical protein